MFTEVISKSRQDLLARLKDSHLLMNFYLAGGTGAALHLGHRKSEDFDFFSSTGFDPEMLAIALGKREDFEVSNSGAGTLHGLVKDTKLSFLLYEYPLLFPIVDFHGIVLADLRDIALMKITAIAGRGSNKDFVDLFFICQQTISLGELLLDLFPRKYSSKLYSMYHIMRSLQYFDDAEVNPPLEMLRPMVWNDVKKFFLDETEKLIKENLMDRQR